MKAVQFLNVGDLIRLLKRFDLDSPIVADINLSVIGAVSSSPTGNRCCVWTGDGGDNRFDNPANWKDGKVPKIADEFVPGEPIRAGVLDSEWEAADKHHEPKPCCDDCKFADHIDPHLAICRRNPPEPGREHGGYGVWPLITHPSVAWCGEFERREE